MISAIPLLDLYSKELKVGFQRNICPPRVQSSIIHNNLEVEATKECPLSGGWVNITWSIYTTEYDFLPLDRKGILSQCYNLDELEDIAVS